MNAREGLIALTILPFLIVSFVAAEVVSSSAAAKGNTQAKEGLLLGPADLRSFTDLTPSYFRFYEPSDFLDYDAELAQFDSKRKRGADDAGSPLSREIGKRLFVARIGKRGRMMPIYRARVG